MFRIIALFVIGILYIRAERKKRQDARDMLTIRQAMMNRHIVE